MKRYICSALIAGSVATVSLPATQSTAAAPESAHAQRLRCIFDHRTLHTPPGQCRPRARHYPSGVTGTAEHGIYDAVLLFGIPYAVFLRIATCESGLNPHASNGSNFGLFQFAPATFDQGATGLYRNTGVVARSVWNALDNAYVAGYLFATGQSPEWSCQ